MAARLKAATAAGDRELGEEGREGTEELARWIRSAISWLVAREPFFGFFLLETPIYASRRVDTACTDGERIYVNPDFFAQLDGAKRAFVLLHEAGHILLMHVPRLKRFRGKADDVAANLAADAKTNQIILDSLPEMAGAKELAPVLPETLVELFGLEPGFVEKASAEEILEEILRRQPQQPRRVCAIGGLLGGGQPQQEPLGGDIVKAPDGPSGEDEVLNPGDEKEAGKPRSPAEMVERVKQRILNSWAAAKAAGRVPAGIERAVKELVKPKVDWRRLLRTFMGELLGGPHVRRTWSRPSRKAPGVYPGAISYAPGQVVVLVDTSGSIGEKELQRFVSEVYAIARDVASVHVIPWDARVYDPIEIKYPGDVLNVKLTGGGGTVLGPALRLARDKFPDAAAYVILSDWDIADVNDPEVQRMLQEMGSKLVAATTDRSPPKFLKRVVDLRD